MLNDDGVERPTEPPQPLADRRSKFTASASPAASSSTSANPQRKRAAGADFAYKYTYDDDDDDEEDEDEEEEDEEDEDEEDYDEDEEEEEEEEEDPDSFRPHFALGAASKQRASSTGGEDEEEVEEDDEDDEDDDEYGDQDADMIETASEREQRALRVAAAASVLGWQTDQVSCLRHFLCAHHIVSTSHVPRDTSAARYKSS